MTDGTRKFLWGVAAGIAAAAFIKTDTFKKGFAKVIAGGLQPVHSSFITIQKYFR